MHRSDFLKLVKEQFPELQDAINKQEQILGFGVQQFGRRAQRAIYEGDRECFEICVRLAERAYLEGNKDLKGSIAAYFVGDMELITPNNSYHWAWEMLPVSLKGLYVDFHGHGRAPEEPRITNTPPRRK